MRIHKKILLVFAALFIGILSNAQDLNVDYNKPKDYIVGGIRV